MKAVILAGGEGTRLRPLTSNQPKPMLPIANVPMMRHVLRLLTKHGFDDIVVTVAFLANQIRNYFGDGAEFGVRMRYATEDSPLGTAGSVRNAMDELDEPFLVIAGDVITDIDLAAVVKAHVDREAFASIALKRVNNPVDFGIVITHDDGMIERFLEKPTWGQVFSDTINTGIYVLDPGVFDYIPAGEVVDFSGDVFPAVLDRGLPLLGTIVDGYWEDVGTLEAYRAAHEDILSERVDIEIPGFKLRDGVWAGEGSDVSPDARVEGPVLVGDNTRVEAGAAVTSSIVWETRGGRTLFGRRGVRGLANVDITSEVAVRLALAYGTSLPKGSVVTTSRDTSRTARALKRAIMAGLNLSGINVMDLELATAPLTRFQVRTERAQGGMTVTLAAGDPDSVEIRFFDSYGADIDEGTQRKIERLLYREDFRRAFAGDIGEIVFPPRAMEYYTAALTGSVDIDAIAERRFKVVLDYSFGAAASVMPNVLAKIGAEVLSINPYASTAYASEAAEDHGPRVERLGNLVRSSGSDLGVVFDADGETATFIDDRGEALSADRALLVLVTLVCRSRPGARLALPVSVSREAERIAEKHGASITWTKLSAAHLMEVAGRGGVDFAASQEGGFIWPDVLPAYDAVATLLHLLDLLVGADEKLSEVSARIPPSFVAHEEVPTPWDSKGAVMREIVERSKGEDLVLVDGVKIIRPEGWVLVLPDPERPVTHVWAEGDTEREANRLVAVQAGRIAEIAR